MKMNLKKLILFICIIQSIFNTKNIRHLASYSLTFDNTNWSYDSSNGVYYQIGVVYCTNPASTDYNSLEYMFQQIIFLAHLHHQVNILVQLILVGLLVVIKHLLLL